MWCETDGFLTTRYLVKRERERNIVGIYILQYSCEVAGNLKSTREQWSMYTAGRWLTRK